MWLIYALGGGWGHLTRAIALARVAQRERPVRILTNSPYASIPADALPGLDVVAFDPHASAEETRRAAIQAIAECRPAVLIVDTFPRGLGGELTLVLRDIAARKVLVHRDLNSEYVGAAGLREFTRAHYDLVLVPGAGEGSQLGDPQATCETRPWLVRSASELPDRESVRERLRLEESCVLVCASGKSAELEWYGAVVRRIRELAPAIPVRFVAAECPVVGLEDCWVRYWPAMDLFSSAAVVVGGGGYNTVQECLACGVPLIARAWPRMYDRQRLRLARVAGSGRVRCVQDAGEAARLAVDEYNGLDIQSGGRRPTRASAADPGGRPTRTSTTTSTTTKGPTRTNVSDTEVSEVGPTTRVEVQGHEIFVNGAVEAVRRIALLD